MEHKKQKQAAEISSCLERYERTRCRIDAQLQQKQESAMFLQQMERVCAEMISSETASEIVEDIESLEIRKAVVDSVVNRIITEEVSVVENICREEMEATMTAFVVNLSMQKR